MRTINLGRKLAKVPLVTWCRVWPAWVLLLCWPSSWILLRVWRPSLIAIRMTRCWIHWFIPTLIWLLKKLFYFLESILEFTIGAALKSLLFLNWSAIPGVKSGFLYGSSLPSLWSTGPFQACPGTNGGGPVSTIFCLSELFILRPAIESSNESSSNFGFSFPQLGFRSFGGGKLEKVGSCPWIPAIYIYLSCPWLGRWKPGWRGLESRDLFHKPFISCCKFCLRC